MSEPVRALLVIDVQSAFVSGPDAVPGADGLLPAVRRLLGTARRVGALVVHVRNDGPPGAPDEPGTPGWALHLPVGGGEPVVGKTEDDAFVGTDLAELLAARGIRSVAVCGVLSEMCVAATVRGALDRGLRVVLPHDAHATYDVPAGPGGSAPVPAAQAARAAEWSLGDGIEIVAGAAEVAFTR